MRGGGWRAVDVTWLRSGRDGYANFVQGAWQTSLDRYAITRARIRFIGNCMHKIISVHTV